MVRVVKHVWKGNGWRGHVVSYGIDYKHRGIRRCSERNCEINQSASS